MLLGTCRGWVSLAIFDNHGIELVVGRLVVGFMVVDPTVTRRTAVAMVFKKKKCGVGTQKTDSQYLKLVTFYAATLTAVLCDPA